MKKYVELTELDKREILTLFRTTKENSAPEISKKLDINESAVNHVINDHLAVARLKMHKKESPKNILIKTDKGVEHTVYTKDIQGEVFFVCIDSGEFFFTSKVTILNK